jgi:hypothetical protein
MTDKFEMRKAFFAALTHQMTFDEWLHIGIEHDWCGPAVCYTHDGLPMSLVEEHLMYEDEDPCLYMIRLYEDEQHKSEIEENHSPSEWRI